MALRPASGVQSRPKTTPWIPSPPREFQRSLQAIRHLESAVAEARDLEGIVLRYGSFYGPGSGMFDGPALDQLRRRVPPVIGDGGGWWSFLHLDDAAEATARAVEGGRPGILTISRMTSPRRFATGFRPLREWSAQSRRVTFRAGLPASPPESTWSS